MYLYYNDFIMIDGLSTPLEAIGVKPQINELAVNPQKVSDKLGVLEMTPAETTRYSQSIASLPNAAIDFNSDPPATYLSLRSDDSRVTIDDVYEDKHTGKITEQPALDRWIKHYTNKCGPIKERISPGRNIIVEPMLDVSSAQVEYLPNNAKIIIINRADRPDSSQIDLVKNAIALGERVSSKFGITSEASDYLLIFTPQASLADSQQDTTERTIVVGTHNIADWNNSDISTVATHEKTHADVQTSLLAAGIDYDRLYTSHFLYPTLRFFNEGIATLAHETVRGKQPRSILKERYQEIPDQLRDAIEKGEYAFPSSYAESQGFNNILEQTATDYTQKVSLTQLLSRYLPAAVTDFCISKGIKIQDIAQVQLEKFQPVKQTVADKYGIKPDTVTIDVIETLEAIKKQKPDLFTEWDSSGRIAGEIEEICKQASIKPFEAISSISKQETANIAQEFISWLNK